ncbi:Putative uncharacterized protein [Taphrina deformans PYCC 5710]|uniref:PIG-P domain-containing protein n=1 Tax=Taphrina deformans (strain PYCC 5710 / ATCC 11124 / CBS 356.35 / IMI 108563 / JCM 9778 / NBRC 8474) TaxID=1097556 RepID=R4XB69_TAPDE|nr:Putative uncharacterized protein [Taphrina deformans PYCC 5710]|eukprot:CCG81577.1 Putative uncharacterized protein [Taphrina deformans PYCC 5710]
MEAFKRQSSQDLTRSRSYNSFLESQSQLPPLYNRPAHLPHQQSFSALLRPGSSRTNSSKNLKLVGKSLPGTPDITSDEGSDAGYFSTFSGPGYLKPSIVPTYEYYGFVLYLSSTVLFGLYLIWGLLGPQVLEDWIGDLGYPDRWWALAIPAWSVVALIYIYVALACYNTQVLTPKLTDRRTITDSHAKICQKSEADKWNQGTDAVLDLPISAVCDALYNETKCVD